MLVSEAKVINISPQNTQINTDYYKYLLRKASLITHHPPVFLFR